MANRNHVISVDLRLGQTNFTGQVRTFQDQIRNMFNPTSFQAGGWISAFNMIERAGIAAFSVIGDQIKNALDYQTSLIGQAGNLSNVFRNTYGEGAKLAKAFNIADAKANAGLPFGALRGRFRQLLGDDALTAFGDTEEGINRSVGFLGKAAVAFGSVPGVTEFQRQNAASAFITGKTRGDLSRQELYRDPVINRSLDQAEIETGINFEGADTNQRFLLMEAFVNKIATPEMISRYQNTLSGALSGLENQLFNPEIGILSFNRELQQGNVSSSVIGSLTRLFVAATKVDGSGFTIFADQVLGFAVNGINSLATAIEGGFGSGLLRGFGAFATGIFLGLQAAVEGLTFAFNLFAVPLDFILNTFTFLSPVITYVTGAFTLLLAVGAANLTFSWVSGLASMVGTLANIGWTTIVSGLSLASKATWIFNGTLMSLLTNPVVLTGAAILGGIAAAGFLVWKFWKPLKGFFSGFWDGFLEGIKPSNEALAVFNAIVENIKNALNPVIEGFRSIGRAVQPAFNSVGSLFNMNQAGEGESRSSGAQFGNIVGGGLKAGLKMFTPLGLIPGLAGGNELGQALSRESSKMPSGAKAQLAVINSSEAVLNRQQQSQIRNSQGMTVNIGGITIKGSNPEEIAMMLENNLENILNRVYEKRSLQTS